MESIKKTVMKNGLRVLFMPIEGARSASVSIWVTAGSRHETEQQQGISHFIEHMLFKGTTHRTSRAISEEMDTLGGSINAYTAKEYTRYYAQTLAENAAAALDILCDMLINPLLGPEELELERGVILDEMAMYQDSGDDVAHETLFSAIWPHSPLGRPICGIANTVAALTADDLKNYIRTQYTPERMVVVIAGGFDQAKVTEVIDRTLGTLDQGDGAPKPDKPIFTPSLILTKKEFEQTSLVLGMPGIPMGDSKRFAMMLLNYILGGGASSRLFQRLREQLGLAYSIYSANYAGVGAGIFTVSASFSANQQQRVLSEINNVLETLANGLTQEEFNRALAQVKASYIMGMETVAARASYAGHNELFEGRQIDRDEILGKLNALTLDNINNLAKQILTSPNRALSVAGDTKDRTFYNSFVKSNM